MGYCKHNSGHNGGTQEELANSKRYDPELTHKVKLIGSWCWELSINSGAHGIESAENQLIGELTRHEMWQNGTEMKLT